MIKENIATNNQRETLLAKAREAMRNAYCSYSQFQVGAALLARDGKVFTGCNVENASYSLTADAERVALFKAVSEGSKEFVAMAIASSSGKPTFPCGACRQVLAEFSPGMTLYIDNDSVQERKLSVLLPSPFNESQM